MQIGLSWLGALNWGVLWTQQNIQGPLTHPTVNTGFLVTCLQLIGTSQTPKGEVLHLLQGQKEIFHLIVTCKCQDWTLKLYSCLCWEVQRAFSYKSPLSFPKAGCEDKKLSCKWLVPYFCLQSAFTAAEMMCKRKQQWYTCSSSPLQKGVRAL